MKQLINTLLRGTGLRRAGAEQHSFPSDFSEREIDTFRKVQPYTMTSAERIVAAIRATEYIVANNIPGAIVECGVWRGGSIMAIAMTLLRLNRRNTPLYLFDTFQGMAEPTEKDGPAVYEKWRANQTDTHNNWVFASLEDVKRNLYSTGYDPNKCVFVKGKVERTLPAAAPESVALLRLDTDWYESTRHELEHLYPRLSHRGVMIIDDYGHFDGCRSAVDEYIQANRLAVLLNRIDYTGRIAVKA